MKSMEDESSSSDDECVEWTERSDAHKQSNDWLDFVTNKSSQSVKKDKNSEQKRDKQLKDDKIRYERELNSYFRDDEHKKFVDRPAFEANKVDGSVRSDKSNASDKISIAERNAMNAKILKAEILGNHDLVSQLKQKLNDLENSEKSAKQLPEERVRYLTTQKRTNDEEMTVKQMFLKEKRSTVEDETRLFLTACSSKRADDEYEDVKPKKKGKHNETSAYKPRLVDYKEESSNCKQCLSNIARHLILKADEHTAVVLTPNEPFVNGYCLIQSVSHSNVCAILSDDECLREINETKRQICALFSKQKLSVIFTETYFKRKKYADRHLVIECIPIKSRKENEAKMFFKKAFLECEEEWSMNKKLIDINGKSITKLIPKGLSYIWVTFGADNNGFAHIIENEESFSSNFAKEIIGGFLDIEPNKWMKRKFQNYEEQYKRALDLKSMAKDIF